MREFKMLCRPKCKSM